MKQPNYLKYIEVNPRKLGGKPLIRGTRIAVEQVLRMLGAGMMSQEIRDDFPNLTEADIAAAAQYASRVVEDFGVYPKDVLIAAGARSA